MRMAEMRTLVDYMYWANHRLLDHAARLTPGQFTAAAPTTRDLRATLVHELDVEWSWRLKIQGRDDEDEGELRPEQFADVAAVRARWAVDEAEMRAWLGTLTDADLDEPIGPSINGHRLLRFHYLMHILTHAAQQQADAATILSQHGQSPGELGFLQFLKEHGARA